jgi:hypothetical protein
MDNNDSIGGSTTSDDEYYLSFTQDELPEEALTNQEFYEQRMEGLKRKMAEQRMEFRASRKRMKMMHEEEVQLMKRKIEKITEKVECPVCLGVPRSGPIHICPNGHFVCKDCKRGSCPTCRSHMGQGKSLLAVTVIENIEHCCKFDDCEYSSPLAELDEHEKLCSQRTVSCPDGDCVAEIALSKLVYHLLEDCFADAIPAFLNAAHNNDRKNYLIGENEVDNADISWHASLYSFDGQDFAVFPTKSDGQYFFGISEKNMKQLLKQSDGEPSFNLSFEISKK